LRSVSCVSEVACTAVGSYGTRAGERTLVERWNGTRWSFQRSTNPIGVSNSRLTGVSCVAVRAWAITECCGRR
jgi:hypothetical protein